MASERRAGDIAARFSSHQPKQQQQQQQLSSRHVITQHPNKRRWGAATSVVDAIL